MKINHQSWLGHVIQRPSDALIRMLEEWGSDGIVSDRRRPKKTWMLVIKSDMSLFGIEENLALDRGEGENLWR